MNFARYLTTPVGRKNTEAITGLLLLLFCVEHLAANTMLLLDDPSPYRWYTAVMGRSLIVRGMEVALAVLFVVHIGLGLTMRLHQRRMRRKNPRIPKARSWSTRTVGMTGVVILIFLVVHLQRFAMPNRVLGEMHFDLYSQAHLAFSNPWYTSFYVFSMAALGFHLHHGVRSAVVSFKRIPPAFIPRVRSLAVWTAMIVTVGLAYIAIHINIASLVASR